MIPRGMAHRTRGWAGGVAAAAGILVAGSTLFACSVDNPVVSSRDGDAAYFAAEVQPVLRAHCAFEGCHGREGMPLSLYAVDYMRLSDPAGDVDPELPALDERALSSTELEHNRRALAANISHGDPTGQAVLRRLLPLAHGGIAHADTVVFDTDSDPDYAILRRFLGSVRVP